MRILFLSVHVALFFYFVRRRFDLFSITFFASTVYFLPAYAGFVAYDYRTSERYAISVELYLFYIVYFILLFAFALLSQLTANDSRVSPIDAHDITGDSRLSSLVFLLRIATPICLGIAAVSTPGGLLQQEKRDLLDSLSVSYGVFQNLCFYYVVASGAMRSRRDFACASAYCVFDLIVGFRSVAAFSLFSLLTVLALMGRARRLVINAGIPLFIAFAFFIGSTYKAALFYFLVGGVQRVVEYFTDLDALVESMIFNEAFSQQHIFNKVLEVDFGVPVDYVLEMGRLFFPGIANQIFGRTQSFNDFFQPYLYPEIPWGMASNVWAEQYSVGGYIWLYIFTTLLFCALFLMNRWMLRQARRGHLDKVVYSVVLVVPALLYMHRNDLLYQLVLVRNMALILLAFGLFSAACGINIRFRKAIQAASAEANLPASQHKRNCVN